LSDSTKTVAYERLLLRSWIQPRVSFRKLSEQLKQNQSSRVREIAGKAPFHIITDGAPNLHAGIEREFWRENKALVIQHVRHVRMSGDLNNNKMERFNDELRDREKVTRNLKNPSTPILAGMQIYHNYVRPYMGLDGKTPAEVAGIKVEGENKLLTLIQNAAEKPSSTCLRKALKR
jgi:hypothetical protein